MLPSNPNIQQLLMIIALPPRLLQPPDLMILQPPPHSLLKLLSANLFPSLDLLGDLNARLKPRLHADS